jgi:hypothetical protein
MDERVRRFAELAPGWDTYGAEPIAPETIDVALRLVPFLESSGLKVWPVPCSDGAIAFEGMGEHDGIDFRVGP